jgi:hypothetical protein
MEGFKVVGDCRVEVFEILRMNQAARWFDTSHDSEEIIVHVYVCMYVYVCVCVCVSLSMCKPGNLYHRQIKVGSKISPGFD